MVPFSGTRHFPSLDAVRLNDPDHEPNRKSVMQSEKMTRHFRLGASRMFADSASRQICPLDK